MKCILHIGVEKTGTSAVQSFFHKNSAKIKNTTAFYYPTWNSLTSGMINHHALAVYAQNDNKLDELRKHCGVNDLKSLLSFRQKLIDDVDKEFSLVEKNKTIVLSSEHCHSRLTLDSEVERLALLLKRYFSEIKIIVYLRIQDEMAISSYSTAVKSGGTSVVVFPREKTHYFSFDSLLLRWEKFFGRANINVRVYSKELLLNSDIVADFCSQIGITELQHYASVNAENERLGLVALQYLRLSNLDYPPYNADGTPNNERQHFLINFLNKYNSDKEYLPSRAEVIAFANHYIAGNHLVEKEYLNHYPKGVLQFAFEKYPNETSNQVSERELVQMGNKLWQYALKRNPA